MKYKVLNTEHFFDTSSVSNLILQTESNYNTGKKEIYLFKATTRCDFNKEAI